MQIKCDKCGSENIEQFAKAKPKEKKPVNMSDFVKNVSALNVVPAVYVYTTMVLLCRDCGYRLEYTV